MEFEKLFGLIHDLSSSQRRNLSLYVGNKKDTRAYKLYQRILKYPELNDETSSKIRGNMFLDPHQFHQDREKLARWVISSIVGGQNGKISPLAFIKESYLRKADNLARKEFLNEVKRLSRIQKFGELARLHDLVLELQNLYSIRISWPHDLQVPPEYFSSNYAFQRQSEERLLNEFIVQIRSVATASSADRIKVANRIYPLLLPEYKTSVCQCLALKIRMNLAYFLEHYEDAFQIAEDFIPLLMEIRNEFSPSMVAKELRFASILSTLLNNRDSAIQYAMKLSELEPTNRIEESFIPCSRIMVYATVAVCFAEPQLAHAAFTEIPAVETDMDPISYCRTLHNIGAAFFMNDDYRHAARSFHKVRNNLNKDLQFLQWEPSLYLAIAHLELGDVDLADSMLESARNSVSEMDLEYPKRCVAIVSRYMKMHHRLPFFNQELKKALDEIEVLLINDEERRSSNLFAATIWIKSKLKSTSQRVILRDSIDRESMKLRIAAFA